MPEVAGLEVAELMQLRILALNCGSSSLKFGVYAAEGDKANSVAEGEG